MENVCKLSNEQIFIKIHSVITCIHKIVKSNYQLHRVSLLEMTQLQHGVFS